MTNEAEHSEDPAASLVDYFTRDHRRCDAGWTDVAAAADAGDDARLTALWPRFRAALLRHLALEEQLLFPAVESATGMGDVGPTQVMRMEHEQMRGVVEQMNSALARGDAQELVDQGDTLDLLIQQHNVKEEGVLYPLAERVLAADWPELRTRLDAFELDGAAV
jgi:iron-sulfur cluster repair protein YtfE (RIC family)